MKKLFCSFMVLATAASVFAQFGDTWSVYDCRIQSTLIDEREVKEEYVPYLRKESARAILVVNEDNGSEGNAILIKIGKGTYGLTQATVQFDEPFWGIEKEDKNWNVTSARNFLWMSLEAEGVGLVGLSGPLSISYKYDKDGVEIEEAVKRSVSLSGAGSYADEYRHSAVAARYNQGVGRQLNADEASVEAVLKNLIVSRAKVSASAVTNLAPFVEASIEGLLDIPDVIGDTLLVASNALVDAGFVVVVTEAYDELSDPGEVIAQNPDSSERHLRGTLVTITVSKGAQFLTVPDVTGQAQADAENALTAAGFAVQVESAYDDLVPDGLVISQDPRSDEDLKLKRGGTVILTVSQGPEPI